MDDLGLHSFQETGKMVRKWCKRITPTCSNRFKAIPLSFRWMLSRLHGICEAMIMWSTIFFGRYLHWTSAFCSTLNFEAQLYFSNKNSMPTLIQHNSITDKVSHTFPVSSVCSKAPPIPPLARRVCRGIGTHHHCLLAYGKKGHHAGQTNRLQNFLTLLIFNDQTQHCGSSSSLFYFPTMRIHEI